LLGTKERAPSTLLISFTNLKVALRMTFVWRNGLE